MKRKVVKHGNSTLTISLPIQWAKKFEIKSGDELDIEERGNKIIVKPYNEHTEKEYLVNINTTDYIPKLITIIPYLNGYNKIKIKFKNRIEHEYLNTIIKDFFMGFEIIDQGKDYVVIKNIAKGIEEEFDIIFNRLIIITISMLKDIKEAFVKKDLSIISNARTSEMNANKINLFCRRMLNMIGHKERRATGLYAMATHLEQITDDCRELSDYAVKNKVIASKEIIEYLDGLIEKIELWYKAFNENHIDHVIKIKVLEKKLEYDTWKLIDECNKNEKVIAHYLAAIQETLHNMTEELC